MSCLPWMINLEAILKLYWGPYEFPNQEKKDNKDFHATSQYCRNSKHL